MSLPFSLTDVRRVTFFKRDELTTDLICCEVEIDAAMGPKAWLNHEEEPTWNEWLDELATLPGFDSDWYSKVCLPPFAASPIVAYERPIS